MSKPILPRSIAQLLDQYELWRKGVSVELMEIEDLETLCLYLTQKKHPDTAKVQEILEWAETCYPSSSIWSLLRASLFLTNKKEKIATEKAIAAIWKAVTLEPENIDAWLHLCELYIKEEKPIDGLIQEYVATALNEEDFIFFIEELICILEAHSAYASALRYYLSLITHAPKNPDLTLQAVFCAYAANQLSIIKTALSKLPSSSHTRQDIYLALALIDHLQGRASSALNNYNYALSLAPLSQHPMYIWQPLLQHIIHGKAYEKGLAFIKATAAFCVFPTLYEQQFLLKAYTHLNDIPNILRTSKAILKIDPLNKTALTAHTTICWKMNQWEKAIALLKKSDRLCSGTQAPIHYLLGASYQRWGKPELSLSYYASYLSYYPKKWQVWALYLEALIADKQYEKTMEQARCAHRLTQRKEAWIFLAAAYEKTGRNALAATFLHNACEGKTPRLSCMKLYQRLLNL